MDGGRLLLVDADPASLRYLAEVLRQEGYEPLLAASGQEAFLTALHESPGMVLADPALPDVSMEEFVANFRRDARTASLRLVALSSHGSAEQRTSCLKAGFSDFLVKSPQLVPSLRQMLVDFSGNAAIQARRGGLLFAFLSAKGGTGTSSLCANLAMNMADRDQTARVAVADLALPMGTIAGIVGYTGTENLATMSRRPASQTDGGFLQARLTRIPDWGFHLLAGSPDPESSSEIDFARADQLIGALQSSFDIVVMDLGRTLSRISMPLIKRADVVALVVTADATTAGLSKTVWEYLSTKGVHRASVYVIMNRTVGLVGLTKEEVERTIGLRVRAAMPYLAENVSFANDQHHPYCVRFPADTASIILGETASQMVEMARQRRLP
jgi:MinD-like ATPase involved in chromosome partitioning or flagellar assembly/ActR/RegA family two-component response regulator